MKVIFVAGGSYKSFYLNYFVKLKHCDVLIFNFNILYDYVLKDELLGNALVSKELKTISKKLKCKVVAGINAVYLNNVCKSILVCDGDRITVSSVKFGAKIFINKKAYIVGDEKTNYFYSNKIILSKNRIYPKIENCSKNKIYLFCDSYGVSLIENKNFSRKINKYSKIVLK